MYRKTLLFIFVSILFLFIVFSSFIYSPYNYYLQYNINNVYEDVDREYASIATNSLISYFLYFEELNENFFSKKEIIHYSDVRDIFTYFFFFFIFSVFALIYMKPKKNEIYDVFKKLRYIIFLFIFIIPVFSYFWNEIFHKILFSNNYWIMNSSEISYYLFPNEFFIFTLVLIIIISEVLIAIFLKEIKNNSKFIKN